MNKYSNLNSTNRKEIKKFTTMSDQWWKPKGSFKALHDISQIRGEFIIKSIKELLKPDNPQNIKILDIGCGGGIISEILTKHNFSVVGIDPVKENIAEAIQHAKQSNLQIEYKHTTIEEFTKNNQHQFDIILNMDVIEHVNNPQNFIAKCLSCMKNDGIYIASTINRTLKAKLLAKFIAEYVLRWLQPGTHNFDKFITPYEYKTMLNQNNLEVIKLKGISYDILSKSWYQSSNLDINYLLCAQKII